MKTLLLASLLSLLDPNAPSPGDTSAPPLNSPPSDVYVLFNLDGELITVANSCGELYRFADAYALHDYRILRYEQADLKVCEPDED